MKATQSLGRARRPPDGVGLGMVPRPPASRRRDVNIMTSPTAIAEPLQRHAPEFEKAPRPRSTDHGAVSDSITKLLTDWSSGTNSVDAASSHRSGWATTSPAASPGHLRLGRQGQGSSPGRHRGFFRDFSAKYNGKTYLIPLDGGLPHDLLPDRRV